MELFADRPTQDPTSPQSGELTARGSSELDRPLSEPLLRRLQERSLVCLPLSKSQGASPGASTVVVAKPASAQASFDDQDSEDNVFFDSSRLAGATLVKAIQHITEPATISKGTGIRTLYFSL